MQSNHRVIIWLVGAGALVLALVQTLFAFRSAVASGWQRLVWSHIPEPAQVFLSNTIVWWIVLALAACTILLIQVLKRILKASGLGDSVTVFGSGGGGRQMIEKGVMKMGASDRAHIRWFGVYPRNGARRAREPFASLLRRYIMGNGAWVNVPWGIANTEAAAKVHEVFAKVYRPIARWMMSGTNIVVSLVFFGGNTGTQVAQQLADELRGEKSNVIVVMGDSPQALLEAMQDANFYAKCYQYEISVLGSTPKVADGDVKYPHTANQPGIVGVSQ